MSVLFTPTRRVRILLRRILRQTSTASTHSRLRPCPEGSGVLTLTFLAYPLAILPDHYLKRRPCTLILRPVQKVWICCRTSDKPIEGLSIFCCCRRVLLIVLLSIALRLRRRSFFLRRLFGVAASLFILLVHRSVSSCLPLVLLLHRQGEEPRIGELSPRWTFAACRRVARSGGRTRYLWTLVQLFWGRLLPLTDRPLLPFCKGIPAPLRLPLHVVVILPGGRNPEVNWPR